MTTSAKPAIPHSHSRGHGSHRRWSRWGQVFVWLVAIFAVAVVANLARQVDWRAVARATREIPSGTLLLALGLVVAGYLLYGSFDLLARRYLGQRLPASRVLGIAVISYALNLNLGVLIGGLAVRLRLYGALGLRRSAILRLTGFSVTTNWMGYCWIAGAVLASGVTPVPPEWHIGNLALRATGGAMLLAGAGYVLLCARSRRRHWTVRGHRISLPTGRMAVAQCAVSALSWATMGAIMYVLLLQRAPYFAALGVLLCTALATVVVRVPGGLGTNEAIFVAALSGFAPPAQVLGAALVYRAMYALLPMAVCGLGYLWLEARRGLGPHQRTRAPSRGDAR